MNGVPVKPMQSKLKTTSIAFRVPEHGSAALLLFECALAAPVPRKKGPPGAVFTHGRVSPRPMWPGCTWWQRGFNVGLNED